MGIRKSHRPNLESTWVDVKFTLYVKFAVYRTVYFKDKSAQRILRK